MGRSGKQYQAPFEIDLSRSRAPRAFRGRQNLWKDELKRIYRLVDRQYQAVLQAETEGRSGRDPKEIWADLPHVSIAIFGPSGSGKSSLLKTLVQDVDSEDDPVIEPTLKSNVGVLPVMDPTTWGPTDQFLYAFLASALETERKRQSEQEHRSPQGLSPVQLAFQEVNEYLRVVDEPERSEEHDPLGLSLQKLERHTAGLRLSESVGRFVQELARMFHAKVVLMPVDDLDMAPEHLMNSLETYQSFLRHPRLIPVFTFTDRLAEELIDVHFRNQFKNGNYSPDPMGKRLTISTKMAVQSLARCFPVRNRIRLGPAPARVQRARFKTRAGHSENDSKLDKQVEQDVLELLISSSFVLFGHPDSEDAHQVKAVLRPSTLRLQMQVVDAMSDCRFRALRTPQFLTMAGSGTSKDFSGQLEKITKGIFDEAKTAKETCVAWRTEPAKRKTERVKDFFSDERTWGPPKDEEWKKDPAYRGFVKLAMNLRELKIGATWATIFSGATWSLLNVHRDALQELGLYLEDLYSWTPKELRSVVLNNILAQDRATRRTVVDRWFNRSDIRRSQILSLLAANIFRPWMIGEEPYGDDETPIREQMRMDRGNKLKNIDERWSADEASDLDRALSAEGRRQVRHRLMILAPKGLQWFLNLTLGFYLPQIMARSWEDALPPDDSVRDLMDGNGWDLERAPVNAARIADAKREIFPFGMLFLDLGDYEDALRMSKPTNEMIFRRHLLLRIWTCCGASRGRFWATFSFWRGLGFIGAVLKKGIKYSDVFALPPVPLAPDVSDEQTGKAVGDDAQKKIHKAELTSEIRRLIHSHILNGLLSGPIISRNATNSSLRGGFTRWEPHAGDTQEAVQKLAGDLVDWLDWNFHNVIYPMPAGNVWMGWRECFVRRLHGEAILGSLWPRLESGYIENQGVEPSREKEGGGQPTQVQHKEAHQWTANTACEVWSNHLLEYWKGCSPILLLLLSCPVFPKSREHFAGIEPYLDLQRRVVESDVTAKSAEKPGPEWAWLESLDLGAAEWKKLLDHWYPKKSTENLDTSVSELDTTESESGEGSSPADRPENPEGLPATAPEGAALSQETIKEVNKSAAEEVDPSRNGLLLPPEEFDIPRAKPEDFAPPEVSHHKVETSCEKAEGRAGSGRPDAGDPPPSAKPKPGRAAEETKTTKGGATP